MERRKRLSAEAAASPAPASRTISPLTQSSSAADQRPSLASALSSARSIIPSASATRLVRLEARASSPKDGPSIAAIPADYSPARLGNAAEHRDLLVLRECLGELTARLSVDGAWPVP